jgi:hypothetical protein
MDGDIIVYQLEPAPEAEYELPTAREYYRELFYRVRYSPLLYSDYSIVVDPHWRQCGSGSGSSFLYQCGSGSSKPNQCGSGSWSDLSHEKLNLYMKNILKVGNRSKNIHTKEQKPF